MAKERRGEGKEEEKGKEGTKGGRKGAGEKVETDKKKKTKKN